MRHRKTVKKLGRTASHRKATLANLASSLFERKHIMTTEAKARAVRSYSERLITLAKKDTIHARRIALTRLHQRKSVQILFDEIAGQYTDRPGGYTRMVKLGQRTGDGARMAILELVGFDTASKKKKEKDKAKEAKEAKKKKKKAEEAEAEEPVEEEKKETKKKASKKAEQKTDKKKEEEPETKAAPKEEEKEEKKDKKEKKEKKDKKDKSKDKK